MRHLFDEFTVLHVDNDSHILDISKQVLPQEDDRLVVETMTDPVAAVDTIKETDYDAVISEYQMPDMDGLELLETVRQEQNHTLPFILFTDHNREEVVAEALNLGADWYVRKEEDPEAQSTEVADAVIQELEHANPDVDLQVNERKYAEMCEHAPLAVVIWADDGTVVDWNKKAEKLFGWSLDQARGKRLQELLVPQKKRSNFEALSESLLTENVPTDWELETVSKDGRQIMCHWYNTPFENAGNGEVASMIVDITKSHGQKAKLREYAAAIEASDDSIYMLDTAGNYVFANQEHLNRLAADGKILEAEEPEVIGRSYADIHPEPDADRITDILHEVLESNEPKTEEYAFKTEDTWSYRTYSPVTDPETEDRIGVVVISKDITQRKRIEQREAFLSSLLRHDIKNKLHTADGYLDLIDDDCPPTAKDHIETAISALSDSIELIEKTGTLSGLGTEETEVCPLHEVLEGVIDGYRSQAAAKGITLNYDGCEGSVLAGPLLESLFRNLIDNALTHSNADVIDISCRQDGGEYVVVVADDGDGIPTETATQLLEQGVSEGSMAGTGLGLYLVAEIADTYGGSVELDSSETGGLRAVIQLQAA